MSELAKLANAAAAQLKRRGEKVAVAESSTGGLISAVLLAVPGASAYFVGGTVIYTAASRRELLQVRAEDVSGLKPLTEPMAAHFAKAVRGKLSTEWGLSELGAAGPTGTGYGHPPGTSVIAVDGPVCLTVSISTGGADREANMWRFTEAALALLTEALKKAG